MNLGPLRIIRDHSGRGVWVALVWHRLRPGFVRVRIDWHVAKARPAVSSDDAASRE